MDWRNSLLVGGATFLVGSVLMEIGDKPKGDIGWWPYVGTFISGAVGFMLLTNQYTPKALELNADETNYTMYGREYFEQHDNEKNQHKYYALFKIDKPGRIISYWSAHGRVKGFGQAGSTVVNLLGEHGEGIRKYEKQFALKDKKYSYLGSTFPAGLEANAVDYINTKWPQMGLGIKKSPPKSPPPRVFPKSPPKSPPKEPDARKARLQKRFGFGAEDGIVWDLSPDWDKEEKRPRIAPIDVDWATEFIKKGKFVKNFGAEMFDTRLGRGSFGEVYLYNDKAMKIVDLANSDNKLQADFFEKIYLMNQKGMKTPDSLVKIIHYNRGTITPELYDELEGNSQLSGKPVGSPIAIWVMELVPVIYDQLPYPIKNENEEDYRDEMRDLGKWTEKNLNYQIGDLHDENIGLRDDGSLVVFDPHINKVGDARRYGFIHVAETNE